MLAPVLVIDRWVMDVNSKPGTKTEFQFSMNPKDCDISWFFFRSFSSILRKPGKIIEIRDASSENDYWYAH